MEEGLAVLRRGSPDSRMGNESAIEVLYERFPTHFSRSQQIKLILPEEKLDPFFRIGFDFSRAQGAGFFRKEQL